MKPYEKKKNRYKTRVKKEWEKQRVIKKPNQKKEKRQ
jgi:hypothetical protein